MFLPLFCTILLNITYHQNAVTCAKLSRRLGVGELTLGQRCLSAVSVHHTARNLSLSLYSFHILDGKSVIENMFFNMCIYIFEILAQAYPCW